MMPDVAGDGLCAGYRRACGMVTVKVINGMPPRRCDKLPSDTAWMELCRTGVQKSMEDAKSKVSMRCK